MKSLAKIVCLLLGLATMRAQILPPPTVIGRSSTNTQAVVVQAGAAPTSANITVDSIPAGGDQIEVVATDPAISISLVLPGGASVNGANARAAPRPCAPAELQ